MQGDAERLPTILFMHSLGAFLGATWDRHAMQLRRTSEREAGILGFGLLIWAYFGFTALDCKDYAQRCGDMLLKPEVRNEERCALLTRQEAYYDLAAWMHNGQQGKGLSKLAPMLPLAERKGWEDATALEAAVKCHAEKRGEQFTHEPAWYCWPAELYALARRAGAVELLPQDNPFLNRPFDMSHVDQTDKLVVRMLAMSKRLLA
jgi:hypothetical protein